MSEITFSKTATITDALYEAQKHCINKILQYARPATNKLTDWHAARNPALPPNEEEGPWATPSELDAIDNRIMAVHGQSRLAEALTDSEQIEKFFTEAKNLAEAISTNGGGKFHIHFQEILSHEKNSKVEWQMIFQINGKSLIVFTATSKCHFSGSSSDGSFISGINYEFKKNWMPVDI